MKSLVEQTKEQVQALYEEIFKHYNSSLLLAKLYGRNNELLFNVEKNNISVFEPERGILYVMVDIPQEDIEKYVEDHYDEPPHFISRVDYWDELDNPVLINSIYLDEEKAIISADEEISITYSFSSSCRR